MSDSAAIVAHLDRLLDDQSSAIRSGNLVALAGMASRAEGLLKDADRLDAADAPALVSVRRKAETVMGDMLYVLRGIRDARKRVESALGVSSTLETYDQSGKAHVIRSDAGQVERRL